MKRVMFLFIASILLLSTVSAEIIFDEQPSEIYNLGDSVDIPITIKATEDVSSNFNMLLICSGKQKSYFMNGVSLDAGEEKKMETSLILNRENIGASLGNCKIKASLADDYVMTEDFEISNLVTLQMDLDDFSFSPGESMIVRGNAIKQTGEDVDGFISLKIVSGNTSASIERLSTISNGFFSINVTFPEGMKAGNHIVQLSAYELNSDEEETNKGSFSYNVNLEQVPTSLEVLIENSEMEPGKTLRAKAILHDQTGESIPSDAIITIKKSKNEIVEQTEIPTGEFLDFEIPYNEAPGNWTVVAVSTLLDSSNEFTILEKREIDVEIVNGTVFLTNKGNVPYNDSVVVKIGDNSSLNLDVFLEVDESKRYELRAPDGEYYVEVITDGESKFGESVLLTGRAVDLKELGGLRNGFIKTIVWVFVILVLGFVVFLIYRKGYKKSFFGSKKKVKNSSDNFRSKKNISSQVSSLVKTNHMAVLTLSIKGDKHPASVVCLKIKNLKEIDKKGIEETIKRIVAFAEGKKAAIYESQENIFFIFSALKTKTFKNEKSAISLAQKIEELLNHHNRIFKHKMDTGLSINYGEIIARVNGQGELEFMATGNLIASSKKLSGIDSKDILLSKDFRDKVGGMVKTQEREIDGRKVYRIVEVRDREQHAKFLTNFLHGLEKDKIEKEKREKKG